MQSSLLYGLNTDEGIRNNHFLEDIPLHSTSFYLGRWRLRRRCLNDAKLTGRSCYAVRGLLVHPQNLNLEIQYLAHDQQNLGLNLAKPPPPVAAAFHGP
jgi:hypothetical protein